MYGIQFEECTCWCLFWMVNDKFMEAVALYEYLYNQNSKNFWDKSERQSDIATTWIVAAGCSITQLLRNCAGALRTDHTFVNFLWRPNYISMLRLCFAIACNYVETVMIWKPSLSCEDVIWSKCHLRCRDRDPLRCQSCWWDVTSKRCSTYRDHLNNLAVGLLRCRLAKMFTSWDEELSAVEFTRCRAVEESKFVQDAKDVKKTRCWHIVLFGSNKSTGLKLGHLHQYFFNMSW